LIIHEFPRLSRHRQDGRFLRFHCTYLTLKIVDAPSQRIEHRNELQNEAATREKVRKKLGEKTHPALAAVVVAVVAVAAALASGAAVILEGLGKPVI
jgi:hypothetical protein